MAPPFLLLLLLLALNSVSCRALAPPAPSAFLAEGPAKKKRRTPPSRRIGRAPLALGGRFHRGIGDGAVLGTVRGGDDSEGSDDDDGDGDGDADESDDGSYEYDRAPDEDETDAEGETDAEDASTDAETEDLSTSEDEEEDGGVSDAVDDEDAVPSAAVQPSPEELARAQKAARLSAQSRNLAVATALWASLFFDVVLNDAKRSLLFPAATAATTATALLPTVRLASGFGLASAASFLLWRDAEVRAERLSSDDGGSAKGDAFLSLSSAPPSRGAADAASEEAEREDVASRVRTGLLLHLSLFGLLGLAAHAGRLFSAEAPFLGASGAVICGHNVLVCASALVQEGWPRFLRRGEGTSRTEEPPRGGGRASLLYRTAAAFAWARGGHKASSVAPLLKAGLASPNVAGVARRLSLFVASLARLALVGGTSAALGVASASAPSRRAGLRRHPFFRVLGAALGLAVLSTGSLEVLHAKSGGAVADGAVGVLFGAFAACDAAAGLWGRREEERSSSASDSDS